MALAPQVEPASFVNKSFRFFSLSAVFAKCIFKTYIKNACIFMPLQGQTGRWRYYVLDLSVRLPVCLLPYLWTQFFENEWTNFNTNWQCTSAPRGKGSYLSYFLSFFLSFVLSFFSFFLSFLPSFLPSFLSANTYCMMDGLSSSAFASWARGPI